MRRERETPPPCQSKPCFVGKRSQNKKNGYRINNRLHEFLQDADLGLTKARISICSLMTFFIRLYFDKLMTLKGLRRSIMHILMIT